MTAVNLLSNKRATSEKIPFHSIKEHLSKYTIYTVDVEQDRLFLLAVQLSFAFVVSVLQGGGVAHAGVVRALHHHLCFFIIQRDVYRRVRHQTRDCAFLTRLSHHDVIVLEEPHLRI